MGAFTCNQHNATVRRRDCCSKGRRGRISDSAPQRLVVKLRALRQECQRHSKPGSPSLSNDDIVRFNKIRPASVERVCGNRIAARTLYWSERTWSNGWFLISFLNTPRELSEDIFHFDVGINLCAHMSAMVTDIDGLFRVKMRCEGARAEVRKNSGEGKTGSIHERLDSVLQLRTTGQDSWQNASGLGRAESFNDRGDRPLQ